MYAIPYFLSRIINSMIVFFDIKKPVGGVIINDLKSPEFLRIM